MPLPTVKAVAELISRSRALFKSTKSEIIKLPAVSIVRSPEEVVIFCGPVKERSPSMLTLPTIEAPPVVTLKSPEAVMAPEVIEPVPALMELLFVRMPVPQVPEISKPVVPEPVPLWEIKMPFSVAPEPETATTKARWLPEVVLFTKLTDKESTAEEPETVLISERFSVSVS